MSANPADEALERLNYFNGQRLAANDFRAEQGYHLGMRRVLNRSLYSPGIIVGLEVEPDKTNTHRVIVRHGLAFDNRGREIFLPIDVFVQAMGAPSSNKGVVFGNLLVISYREQRSHPVSDGCAVAAPCTPCSGDLAWGAPTRIVADAMFEILDSWPSDDSGRVVIAQLELSKTCEVVRVLPGVRKYAVPVKPQTVIPVSIEGEKDIDTENAKEIHFHIAGGFPERAVLMLRARKFSSLYYSEIGEHVHPLDLKIDDHPAVAGHQHKLTNATTDQKLDPETLHFNAWVVRGDPQDFAFRLWKNGQVQGDLWNDPPNLGPHLRITNTLHSHGFDANAQTDAAGAIGALNHHFNKQVTESFGVTALSPPPRQKARDGRNEYGYVKNLRVHLDGIGPANDITNLILAQLKARQPAAWDELGDGTGTHALASDEGTDEIDLLKLGIELGLGGHTIRLSLVPPIAGDTDFGQDRGGQVQYNLYVS
jgi:hypothetical protein